MLDSYSPKAAFIFADYFNLALASDDGKVAVQPSDQPYINEVRNTDEGVCILVERNGCE